MRKPVQSNAEEGYVLARVRSEAVFARNAANVARKNSLVLMSWPLLATLNILPRGGFARERKREKVRA